VRERRTRIEEEELCVCSVLIPFLLFYLFIYFLEKEMTCGTMLFAMSCDIARHYVTEVESKL